MPDYNIQLTERETKILQSLGIMDPHTKLNAEDVDAYRHSSNLYMRQFNEPSKQSEAISAKLFLRIMMTMLHPEFTQKVDVLTSLAADFSLKRVVGENDPRGFTQQEIDFLATTYSQINLLSTDGTVKESIPINDDENLPLLTLINPFPLSAECMQFLREIGKPNIDVDLQTEVTILDSTSSHGSKSVSPSIEASSSTMPLFGEQGNPSQDLVGFTIPDIQEANDDGEFRAAILNITTNPGLVTPPLLQWSPVGGAAATTRLADLVNSEGEEEEQEEVQLAKPAATSNPSESRRKRSKSFYKG